MIPPPAPRRDPLVDTGPPGLHSFNLGSIPASVTPPRTWRRAAWFMIFSSVAALLGLLFVASTLVRPRPVADRLPTLPDLPTGPQLIAPTPDPAHPDQTTGYPRYAPRQRDLAGGGAHDVGGTPTGRPGTGGVGRPGGPGGPGGGPATSIGTAPGTGPGDFPTMTIRASGPPSADPVALAQRTQTFFHDVTSDAQAAAALTVSTVRDDAAALIDRRYGQIATIRVQSISLDPNSGITVSVLKVTNRDGTTATEQTTLHFTLGGDPRIENPGG